jgi:hydrogenase-4 component F
MTMPAAVPFLALLAPLLLAALLAPAGRRYPRTITGLHAVLALTPVAASLWLAALVVEGAVPTWGPGALLRVDALSALLAVCVASVSALAIILGLGPGHAPAGETCRFRLFASLFAFTMLVAVTTDNVAVMWVAIEATTITSAVLVPLHRSRASVEASWKYILIGSVGIALAFVGTVLAYFDFVTLAGESEAALHWTVLMAAAPR